jgi:hypothetical protein
MPNLNTFEKLYDPQDHGMSTPKDREKARAAVAASVPAMKFFLSNPRSAVYQSTQSVESLQFLFTVEMLFGRVVPSIAKFIGFSKTAELGFYSFTHPSVI